MYRTPSVLLAAGLAFAGAAAAAPAMPFGRDEVSGGLTMAPRDGDSGFLLVQRRGGGEWRGGGGFNSGDFHRNVSNTQGYNRNVNRNVNRNYNGGGGCCYGNYNSGPSWGGVAAGVATGAVLGAAVSSYNRQPAYAYPPPPAYYPPGYVTPPPY
jgi:hypothetical protein